MLSVSGGKYSDAMSHHLLDLRQSEGWSNDPINGAVHNPDTYREYCRIEAVTGYSFRKDFWMFEVKPKLLHS